MVDLADLAAAASQFSNLIGPPTDDSAKAFLDRYPLPVIFEALQSDSDVPGLQSSLVSCLGKILKTQYGLSLLPQCVHYLQAGLGTESSLLRQLACDAIAQLLESNESVRDDPVQIIIEHNIWPSLVACIGDCDESVAMAAAKAVKNLAKSPRGLALICPKGLEEVSLLKSFADSTSSMVRIRILSLLSSLFLISDDTATTIYHSGLLQLFERELNNSTDMLATLNALEVLYEMASSSNASKYLLTKNLLSRLSATICSRDVDSILRSRAMSITGRLLSSDSIYTRVDELEIKNAVKAFNTNIDILDIGDNELEVAIDALGQIGIVKRGAELLLIDTPPCARHVVDAAFSCKGRSIRMAGIHSLATISGDERTQESVLLNERAEASLRNLIYVAGQNSSKRSPSGLLLSLLQQEPDIRLAAYRLIRVLVPRPWCLMEICMKKEIIDIVTDSHSETTKTGMEFRHSCCVAINNSLINSHFKNDASCAGIIEKLQAAIKRGPYLAREFVEAKPIVSVQERF